jgi:CRP-like cAMP-binding protein
MEQLINFIRKHVTLENSLKADLSQIFLEEQVEKGGVITNQNTYCRNLYFIKKGIVKFCFNSGDKEFIMRFFEEGVLFTEIESWNKKEASKYEVIALENTQYITIPLPKFEELCKEYHSLESFYRKLMMRANLNMMDRIKEMLEEDAKKRYLNFIRDNPNLLQRISLGDLSKYLGITQVSLSRVRAEIQ